MFTIFYNNIRFILKVIVNFVNNKALNMDRP